MRKDRIETEQDTKRIIEIMNTKGCKIKFYNQRRKAIMLLRQTK